MENEKHAKSKKSYANDTTDYAKCNINNTSIDNLEECVRQIQVAKKEQG